jgi:hypothetical protein
VSASRAREPQKPYQLPASALARIDELVECDPSLSPEQQRLIQRSLGPALARIAERAARAQQAA